MNDLEDVWGVEDPEPPEPGWDRKAACRGMPIQLFYDGYTSVARNVCAGCPVRTQCLTDTYLVERSLRLADIYGYRGVSATQRATFFRDHPERRRIRLAAECGTEGGYHAHLYRDEPTCPDCRRAHTAAEWWKRKRAQEYTAPYLMTGGPQ